MKQPSHTIIFFLLILASNQAFASNPSFDSKKVSHEGIIIDNISNTVDPINTIQQAFIKQGWEVVSNSEGQVKAQRFHKKQQAELTLNLINHSIAYICKCYKTKIVRQNGKRVEYLIESFPKKAINKLKKNIRNNLVYKDSAHRSIPIKAESPAVTPKKQNKNDDRLTIKEKMLTLKELHEQGLITDTEYSDKKLELLNTL